MRNINSFIKIKDLPKCFDFFLKKKNMKYELELKYHHGL